MLKRQLKNIAFIILPILLALAQFSFFASLSSFGKFLDLGVVAAVFVIFFLGFKRSIYFIFIFGLTLDTLSFQVFGIYTVSFFISTVAVYFLLDNLLTNRSLYSLLASMVVFTFVYNIALALVSFIYSGLQIELAFTSLAFYKTVLWQTSWGLLSALLLFHLFVFWINKYNPFFLEKKSWL